METIKQITDKIHDTLYASPMKPAIELRQISGHLPSQEGEEDVR